MKNKIIHIRLSIIYGHTFKVIWKWNKEEKRYLPIHATLVSLHDHYTLEMTKKGTRHIDDDIIDKIYSFIP